MSAYLDPENEAAIERALRELPLRDPPTGMQAGIMLRIRFTPQQPAPLNRTVLAVALAATLTLLTAGLWLAWTWLPRLVTPETALILRMQAWYLIQRLEYQILLARQVFQPLPAMASWTVLVLTLGAFSLATAVLTFTGLGIGLQMNLRARLNR